VLLLVFPELALGEPAAERVEPVLTLPARLELPGDAAHPGLEVLLALGEPPLALGHPAGGLAKLVLRLGDLLHALCAIAPALLDDLRIEWLRLPTAPRLSAHSHSF
jgi:hypothetical protein